MGTELPDHRDIVKTPKRHGAHEGTALREAQDVLDLAAAEVGADLVRHRPEALAGEEDVGELSPIGELDGDDIIGADTEFLERRRRTIDPGAELSIRDALSVIDDGLPVGMGCGPLVQDLVEGVSPSGPSVCNARRGLA